MANKFEKIKESAAAEPQVERGVLGKFREKLEGWMTSADGDDYCPDCWKKYLSQFDAQLQESVKKDAKPTAQKDIAKTRKILEGYQAICEKCAKEIFSAKE